MELRDVGKVIEAFSVEEADELLEAGWVLVAVTSGHRTAEEIGPIYVLGKKREPSRGIWG